MKRIVVGIGGASGAIYGIRILGVLRQLDDVETHLVLSKTARRTIPIESDYALGDVEALADAVYKVTDVGASIASGSFRTHGMILAACSMKNMSSVVHSSADDLLTRAADVTLKERRRLVLMPRETPLHVGHCKLLYEAAQLGAIIAPPMPAFYGRPQSIEALIDHTVGRVLDLFDLDAGLAFRWSGTSQGK